MEQNMEEGDQPEWVGRTGDGMAGRPNNRGQCMEMKPFTLYDN